MTMETWRTEFYTVGANVAAAKGDTQKAVRHSLKKWRGLTEENIKKHKLIKENAELIDIHQGTWTRRFLVEGNTCALCFLYAEDKCKKCPLTKVRGTPCDTDEKGNKYTSDSPYAAFVKEGDPEPMIALLEGARTMLRDEAKKKQEKAKNSKPKD